MSLGRVTCDANVLVCSIQVGDPRQPAALDILDHARLGLGVLTLQALGEFFHVASRGRLAPRAAAAAQLARWRAAFPPPLLPSAAAQDAAVGAAAAGRFSYWDALLLATAEEAGCEAVISEDMAPGAALGGVRVVPAFAADGAPSPEALSVLGA